MVFIYENLFFNVKIYLRSTRFIFVVVGFPVNAIARFSTGTPPIKQTATL
jgi:hypothetical protein